MVEAMKAKVPFAAMIVAAVALFAALMGTAQSQTPGPDQNSAGTQITRANLGVNDSQVIAQNGRVRLVAQCLKEGNNRRLRVVAATTQRDSFLDGLDDRDGNNNNNYLQPETAADNARILQSATVTGDNQIVQNDVDDGFVLAPNGDFLGVDGEEFALGVNVRGQRPCFLIGPVNAGDLRPGID